MLLQQETTTTLSPARITRVAGPWVQLEFPDERLWARLALAFPYQPAEGDQVLAIGQGLSWYVIGVLQGTGKTIFTVPGDLEIQAPRGRIELGAAREVAIQSAHVSIRASKLEILARTVLESFVQATRWVKGAFRLRLGRMHALVKSTYQVQAERILERAAEDVHIDGKQIDLG
jgi:hypothetical protein